MQEEKCKSKMTSDDVVISLYRWIGGFQGMVGGIALGAISFLVAREYMHFRLRMYSSVSPGKVLKLKHVSNNHGWLYVLGGGALGSFLGSQLRGAPHIHNLGDSE